MIKKTIVIEEALDKCIKQYIKLFNVKNEEGYTIILNWLALMGTLTLHKLHHEDIIEIGLNYLNRKKININKNTFFLWWY